MVPPARRLAILLVAGALLLFCAVQCVRIGYADWVYAGEDLPSVRAALRILPEDAEYHRRYAMLLNADSSAVEERQRELLVSAALNPRDSRVWSELANAAEARGDLRDAEEKLLRADAVDKLYGPAWALTNFYFRQARWPLFWQWANTANRRSYDNRWPLFRLAVAASDDPVDVLDRLAETRPKVVHEFLDLLMSMGKLEKADGVAKRLIEAHRRDDVPLLAVFCDRLIENRRSAQAVPIWNQMVEAGLIAGGRIGVWSAPSFANDSFADPIRNQGFDWRLSAVPGVLVRQDRGLHVEFDGTQPESFDLLGQYLPGEEGRGYRIATEDDMPDEVRPFWNWHVEGSKAVFSYRRKPGSVRSAGSFTIRRVYIDGARN